MPTILSDNALTTVDNIKARIPNLDDDKFDDLLKSIINGVSDFIVTFCGRKFIATTYENELHDGRTRTGACKTAIRLKNFPITKITKGEYKTGADSWVEFAPTEIVVDYEAGIIETVNATVPYGYRNIRVTYTAGYVKEIDPQNQDTQILLPYDIIDAATKLCVREFKRREHVGKSSESIAGDSVNWIDGLDQTILMVLQKYQNIEFA